MKKTEPISILMADDDEDDRELAAEALTENKMANPLHFVENGEELMDYLHRRGKFAAPGAAPLPGLILLDLNMPRKSGVEALAEIKNDERLRQIPVVVLTTSEDDEDIVASYNLGANSFITKPVSFEGLVNVTKQLDRYWFELVSLPRGRA